MIPSIIVDSDLDSRVEKINQILIENKLKNPHPNLLFFDKEEKLGVAQAKQIIDHMSLKPYQTGPQAVVLVQAEELTPEAQNSLLKTLEEPPENSLIILGVSSEDQLIPTILSRCKIVNNKAQATGNKLEEKDVENIEKFFSSSIEERFVIIEKTEDKDKLFSNLVFSLREKMLDNPNSSFLNINNKVATLQEYALNNVSMRAILEYIALCLPEKDH